MLLRLSLSLLFSGHCLAAQCNADNCLRAIRGRHAVQASSFCATYTTSPQTGTTGLPSYATQCQNSPARISSACSCASFPAPTTTSTTTSSTTTSTTSTTTTTEPPATTLITTTTTATVDTTTTTPPPAPTCVASTLKNTVFELNQNGIPNFWDQIEHDGLGQTYFPYSTVANAEYHARFPNAIRSPNTSYLTFSQLLNSVCNAIYTISFQYSSKINIASPFPVPTGCTLTSGLTGIPSSALITTVPFQTSGFTTVTYTFTVGGLAPAGAPATFYFDTKCTIAGNYPEIVIKNPSIVVSGG